MLLCQMLNVPLNAERLICDLSQKKSVISRNKKKTCLHLFDEEVLDWSCVIKFWLVFRVVQWS